MADNYAFSSSAAPAQTQQQRRGGNRGGFRHGKGARGAGEASNIMFDRRVVRGNTYAAQVVPANAHAEAERFHEEQVKETKKRQQLEDRRRMAQRPTTPDAVPGRRHIDVQTENFLEELTDKVPEVDEETQTEAFMDRPPSPLFMPAKIGLDRETQIEPGDLFDFDREVAPILEVLVGKTLEHSMMEVLEEEELANIRQHQAEFQQMRNAELAEVQRMEAEARRKAEEKERRVAQEKKRMAQEGDLRDKVAARAYAKQYLVGLHNNVFSSLTEQGHFFDPLVREVQEQFMPWLLDAMAGKIDKATLAEKMLDGLVRHALARNRQIFADKLAREAAEKAAREEEERRKREEEEARLAAEAAAEEGDGDDEGKDE